ncbi:MAG: ribonuclease Z [Planctomycetota bacterium]|jgi:ribonuclease Z
MSKRTRKIRPAYDLAGITVEGISSGGIETCIHLPQLKVAFDVGRCPEEVVPREIILFTHAHMDHMGGVAYHCATRELRQLSPPTYVVPKVDVEAFEELFAVWRRLDRSDLKHTTIGLEPGEEFQLPRGLVARAFASPHRAPCQGYALVSTKQKLLPALRGVPGRELEQRRKSGETITEEVETVEVAFTGDSKVEVIEREELVQRARLLICECTFLDERVSREQARESGHIHLDELIERADLLQNEAILLTHFSSRYRHQEILQILDERLPAELRARVTPFLNTRPS